MMKLFAIDQCNCMALRRAARRVSQRYDDALAPAGLRANQFAILAMLRDAEGWNVQDLAERLDLDRTTMGKNLRPLVRGGLIAVGVSAVDRRSRTIRLTDAGRKALETALPLWIGVQRQFEEENGHRRSRELRETLGKLRVGAPMSEAMRPPRTRGSL